MKLARLVIPTALPHKRSQARWKSEERIKNDVNDDETVENEFEKLRKKTAEDDRDASALAQVDNIREEIEGWGDNRGEQRDEILLYEPKPLYVVRQSKQESGGMLFRDFMHACMWGLPNRFRSQKGFLQRARLQDLNMMLDKMYDTDFREMEGGVFIEEVMRLKIEPMLRPRIPSLLNPQFGRTLLNYFLKQMERLNMKRLIIYEVWGHNGQTALSILDILEEEYPHIYSTCEYHMVDVLGAWMTHRDSVIKAHHYDHYFEHHISFFDWEVMVPDRVFFVCLEALSYLPFDRVDVVKSSHRGSTQFNFYELCMCEDINPDDRMEYSPYGLYSKIRSKDWYRPLQDGLIMEYLRHVDMGYFTKERLEQHRYDCLYGDGDNLGDVSEMKAFKRYNPAIGKLKSGATHEEAAYHKMGMLNNQFWVPSMQVSLFDVLRKYFPRHIFVCLDQTDQHTFIPGVKAPTMRQYFGGTYYDMRHYYLHENMMGVTDCRLNISFDDVRTLYYGMMELPPGHPLHLRCVSLRAFFEEYASEDIMKAITVGKEGNRYSQPVDQFMGGKLLVTEFGADLEDIQDKPIDVAICKGHWRQRAYVF